MLASFSHELRTPLNCSIQMIEIIQMLHISDTMIKGYLNSAQNSNKLLLHLIDGILDFA